MMNLINMIPAELKALKQWILYKLEFINDEVKPTKVPYQVNEFKAATNNPNSWGSFQSVVEALNKAPEVYNGLGYVFAADDPYTGIDLDNCFVNGQLSQEAQSIVDHFSSYTEISQSGKGLHLFVKAKLSGTGKKVNGKEIYDRGRYFVVTGNHFPGTPTSIEDRQAEVTEFYQSLTIGTKQFDTQIVHILTPLMEDQEIISIASQAKNGSKFKALFEGTTSSDEIEDPSAVDQSLCCILAFYTRDRDQIDRIFRISRLYRDKWDREDYKNRTIEFALGTVTEQYGSKMSNFKKEAVLQPIHSQDEQVEELDFLHTDNEWNGVLGEAAYYGLVGDVIRQIAPHSEADNTALLLTFLVLFGNLIGIEPHFKVSSEVHRMKLFIVLVGATFKGRKGTSFPPVYNLMLEVDADLKQRKKSGLSSGEGVIHSVRNPTIVREPIFEGQGKSRKSTGEFNEVVEDPGVSDKRMLFVESEFSRVLNALKQDSNTLSAVIRDAWDGNGDLGIVTRNKPISATDTHISIIGHITPEELRDKTRNRNEIYNGFVNRFLWPYVQQSKSLPNGGSLHKEDLDPIVNRIREAVEYAQYRIATNEKGETLPMERDEAADQFWNKIYQPLQRDVPGIIGAASSRAIPYIMRLACTYALLDCTHIVRLEHLKAALAIWEFNYKSIQYIFGEQEVIKDPITIKILGALQNETEGMSFTSISNLLQRHTTGKEIQRVVKKMQENGLITVHLEKGHSGRPRRVIKLNKLDTVEPAN